MSADLEHVSCLCGFDNDEPLFTARDRMFGLDGDFPVARCRSCGLVRLAVRPAPATLPAYYPEDYYPYRSRPARPGPRERVVHGALWAARGYPWPRQAELPGPKAAWALLLAPLASRLRRFPRFVAGGRVLDLGCGDGAFLDYLHRCGWRTVGVDIVPAAVEAARAAGHEAYEGSIPGVELEPGSFDAASVWHTLEHVPRPDETLRALFRLLRPGGELRVGVPNVGGWLARRSGADWVHLDAPRHFFHFTPLTLRRFLLEAGFREIAITTYTQPQSIEWSRRLGGGLPCLRDVGPGGRLPPRIGGGAEVARLRWLPLATWLGLTGRGDLMYAVARR